MPRGGARKGSGPKKQVKSYSDKFKSQLWRALAKQGKAQGKTVFDVFAEKVFKTPSNQQAAFCSLWKTLCEVMAARENKTTIEKHEFGPSIGLPQIKPKPDEMRPS